MRDKVYVKDLFYARIESDKTAYSKTNYKLKSEMVKKVNTAS